MANGTDAANLRFTLSQVLQLVAYVLLGALAWADLKGDVKLMRAEIAIIHAQHAETLGRVRDLERPAAAPLRVR